MCGGMKTIGCWFQPVTSPESSNIGLLTLSSPRLARTQCAPTRLSIPEPFQLESG